MKTAVIIRTGNQTGNRFVSFTNSVLFHLRSWFFAVSGSLRFLIGRFSFLCDTSRKGRSFFFFGFLFLILFAFFLLGLRFFTRRFRFFVIVHRKTGFQFLQFSTEREIFGLLEILILFTALLALFGNALVHWPAVTALQLFTQRTDQMKLMCIEGPLAINFP
ncbi:uncharacterized protein OCT59_013515 [Rhizophagus irregularis]|uniref:Uncharacterized protein n=1 Tax=Rhizophagus irregularis TaxID=588596 RepID=A0A916E5D7_9GLOM|nr:hypothetical protein OCT59_013515 [Rhizophagus irregularis]CAB4495255.1 unnamed protein product [Rhizophagus irregularis]CAB5356057.1 unnamed protein product [Rhizophagus irregularis]